jgi:Tfp pilus assembly protein PilP
MKAMKTILVVMAAAGLAMAQAPAAGKPKAPASQTVSGGAAAPSAAPAQAKAPAKPATAPAAKLAPKAAAKPAAKPAKKPVVAAVAKTPEPTKPAAAKGPAGKRDPFVNPVVRVAGTGGGGPVCSTGKRCLMINEILLRGIVKTQGGMIAVVSNAANRAYFLKENDPVFNGMVVKITGDSVIFKESVVDNLGRESSREVVKRVSAPTV